jgi:hypothetical protein
LADATLRFVRRVVLLLLVSVGCFAVPEPGTARDNMAPLAALRTPVIAPVGSPVRLDASHSFDPDADPLTFVFEITGAEAVTTAERAIDYTFASEGLYTVRVHVVDVHGESSFAAHDITARAEYPRPPDFCATAADCVVGHECDGGVCFNDTSLE